MILGAETLDARVTVGAAREALQNFPNTARVVVRRDLGLNRFWYVFDMADIVAVWNLWDPETTLEVALNLHETDAVPVYDSLDSVPEYPGETAVLADGDLVAVVARSTNGVARSMDDSDAALPTDFLPQAPPPTAATAPSPEETGTETDDTGPFSAYPSMAAPEQVHPGERFDLVIGLDTEAAPGTAGGPMTLAAVGEVFDLVVQVVAQGFEAPEGIRRFLHVRRDNPASSNTNVALIAPAKPAPCRRLLEVEYSYEGVVLGRAWREILVTPVPLAEPAVRSDSAPVTLPAPGSAADLTVTVIEGDEPGSMTWTFNSPPSLGIDLPGHQVETKVPAANARSFAYSQITKIGGLDGSLLLPNLITGIGREVAAAAPVEFWEVLDKVWRAVDDIPSVLLVSSDPYIPWELASTDEEYLDPELTDDSLPMTLGAQVRMGRWIPPGPKSPRGMERPSLPPAPVVDVNLMALVVGDYLAERGQRPLPYAMKEGRALEERYPTVWRSATLEQIDELFDDRLRERRESLKVQAVHIACHGEVDGTNPEHNGIVLSDDNRRLTALMIRGSTLSRSSEPFVFINACQVGQADQALSDYGGLAGAFIKEGASAFIAPLWSVNDVIAHDSALEFYRLTLDDGIPVGEAMRQIRAGYDTEADIPASTPLAYVFYGHPDLTLTLDSES
ncbi:MAG: CHAT domain-containing protein [Acidimicrobiia bacterium]|nr:CHAT domain-containing protein [Acidimicrobiia bacterium]